MMNKNWTTITPSPHPWERSALDFIREGLPDHEPYRAWANFEFQTPEGSIYEVDLLVLTKQGFWLVEIKSRPGRVEGDVASWTWIDRDGRRSSDDNPILLANRKARALSSLLRPRMAAQKAPLPWLDALVFLSDPSLQLDLTGPARNRVCLTDLEAAEGRPARKGILAALINRDVVGVEPVCRDAIDVRTARALTRAMEQVGIRPSQSARRVGDYVLKQLLDESSGVYQDRLAEHAALPGVFCRVRQYLTAQAASEDERQRLGRAAVREFRILQGFDHPGVLDVRDYKEHDFGPALLFAYEPDAVRLDHFLATRGSKLTLDTRIELIRQIADAVRYSHSRKVVHRALSPQSVLVMNPEEDAPRIKVFNWQVGVREADSASSATLHVQELVGNLSALYMAPEAMLDPKLASEASDVYSLGAIAFQLFTSRPPGGSPGEVRRMLETNRGLQVSAVVDGVNPELEELTRVSTDPDVDQRIPTAAAFLKWLDEVEDALTDPDLPPTVDPALARPGDRIEGGYEVKQFLGQGATGVALLVRKGDEERVLKVAREPEDNARLLDEAEALRKLRSEFIVGLHDALEIHGRRVLVLDKSGDETLSDRLRKEGRLGLELLERFGEDLLLAVASLEQQGVAHRDIKPDNIGVRSGKQRLQLVLFDFSLARVPLDQIHVGTRPYLDPFLEQRKPRRWDQSAERYAAGVTLYEMAAGALPRWGKSDPALVDTPLSIEAERFDPAVRDGLAAFFRQALGRDPARRFDNAERMLHAWREVFRLADQGTITTPEGTRVAIGIELDQATPETPISLLGLGTRATNALDRVGITTVRELLSLSTGEVRFMRGVGKKTRDEILGAIERLRMRFPEICKPEPPRPSTSFADDLVVLDLDTLLRRLVEPAAHGKAAPAALKIRRAILGLEDGTAPWPSQAEVALKLRKNRQQVSQVIGADRERWSRDRHVTLLRSEILRTIQSSGGVMTLDELTAALISARGTVLEQPDAQVRLGAAMVRLAYETEQFLASPRLHLQRAVKGPLLALTPDLGAYALRLGEVAEVIAKEDPLCPSLRVFQRLYEITTPEFPPDCTPPNNDRVLRLAAACSASAAVSTRQELYPRNMPARRALQLGLGALTSLEIGDPERKGERLDAATIRVRIAARYPEAEPLPDHPALDDLLRDVGFPVVWDEVTTCYRRPAEVFGPTSGSSQPGRRSTKAGSRKPARAISPQEAEARQFEERLRFALRDSSFLVLNVRPSQMLACERELLRRFPRLSRVSLDEVLLRRLRAKAEEHDIEWRVILEADAAPPGSEDHGNLLELVHQIAPEIEAELRDREQPVLLVHPGLLARYDQMVLLERLRDRVGRKGECPGLWVLVAADEQSNLPVIDGREVPLTSSGQRVRVPLLWIENTPRAAS
jgi:serine/threonine protein kinase